MSSSPSINITMVGHSKTGKSCYLSAMYAKMSFGVNRFAFRPTSMKQVNKLEADWRRITAEGKWLSPTDISTDYQFRCSYSGRPLMLFNWHDYRGGLLTEDGEPVEKLMEILQKSTALIICIDATTILELANEVAGADEPLRIYTNLLDIVLAESGRTIPIAITITKSDLLTDEQIKRGINRLREGCFQSWFGTQEGNDWLVMFTWVSLVKDLKEIKDQEEEKKDEINATIDLVNIHVPVLFSIYFALNNALELAQAEEQKLKQSLGSRVGAHSKEQQSNFLKRWLRRGEIAKLDSSIAGLRAEIAQQGSRLDALRPDVERILGELNDKVCQIYYAGVEMTQASAPNSK